MSIRPHPVALAMAASVTLVAGCGGSTSAGGSPSTAVESSATSSSAAPVPSTTQTSSPTSSNSTAAGAPGVPEPARQHTTAGAIAFAKYYIKKINDTGLQPETGVLEPLALDGCRSCANYENTAQYLKKHHQHASGKIEQVKSAHRIVGESGVVVKVMIDQPRISRLRSDGTVVSTAPAFINAGQVYFLSWTQHGWKVKEIKLDKSEMTQ